MKKRILAIVLMVIMLIPSASFAEETVNADLYREEMEFLGKIGLYNEAQMAQDSFVTRGEFARLLSELIYDGVKTDNPSAFSDIAPGEPYTNGVVLLEGLNIVRGNASGKFSPDAEITMIDAVVMLIRALGYEMYAEAFGGYQAGYIDVAKKTWLTDGMSWVSGGITYRVAMKLLYNSLFVSTVELDYVDEDGVHIAINPGKNHLNDVLDIVNIDAVVINDGMRSFDNSGVLENQAVLKYIDSEETITVNISEDISSLFGKRVDAYVKIDSETGKQELIHARVSSKVTIKILNPDDIILSDVDKVEYETDDSGKTKTIRFNTEVLYAFKNGYKLSSYTGAEFKPSYGEITYIDNDDDGKPDVILIEEVDKHLVASATPAKNEVILCKAAAVNSLDLSGDDVAFRIYKNGKLAELTSIEENDIISVCKSPKTLNDGTTLYTLYVSQETYTGNLTGHSENKYMAFEDREIEVSKPYLNANPGLFTALNAGLKYTLRLDHLGNIAYIDGISSSLIDFCYILNVYQQSQFSELKLYVYTKNAAFNELIISDNLVIDGKTHKNISKTDLITNLSKRLDPTTGAETTFYPHQSDGAEVKANTAIVPRPAIVKVNTKGEVYYIDTDFPTHATKAEEEQDIYALTAGERAYKDKTFRALKTGAPSTINGDYLITEETLIMRVADIDRFGMKEAGSYNTEYVNLWEMDISDITNYKIMTINNLYSMERYDIQPYNINPETGIASFALIRGMVDENGAGTDQDARFTFYVFDRLTKIADTSGEGYDMYRLYYTDGTKEYSGTVNKNKINPLFRSVIFGEDVKSSAGELLYPSSEPLEEGDLILVDKNNNDEIRGIRKHVDLSKINKKPLTSSGYPQSLTSYYTSTTATASPYDMSLSKFAAESSRHLNASTYIFQLSVPVSGDGKYYKILQPYDSTFTQGTLGDWYKDGAGVYGGRESYIGLNQASLRRVLLVEEKKHSSTGECEIKVSKGSVSDIKLMGAYGFDEASRLYIGYVTGEACYLVIYNLLPEHNKE